MSVQVARPQRAHTRVIAIVDLQSVLAAELSMETVLERALAQRVGAVLLRAKGVDPEQARQLDWLRLIEAIERSESQLILHESVTTRLDASTIAGSWEHWSSASLWKHVESSAFDAEIQEASRAVLRKPRCFGVSAHSLAELEHAEGFGASWAFVSPFMPTASKPGYGPTLGLPGVKELCRHTSLPVFALAGVCAETVLGLGATGAAGVAVMGMLAHRRAAEELQRLFQRMEDEPWSRQTPW